MVEQPTHPPNHLAPKHWLLRWLPALALLAGLAMFWLGGGGKWLSLEALSTHRQTLVNFAETHPVLAPATYMLTYALATAFSLPGAVFLTLAGGLLFGLWLGGAYTIIAASLGAVGIFLAARSAMADGLYHKLGPTGLALLAGFRRDAFGYLLALRLIPLFPFWLINLVPAFAGVGILPYFLATLLGITPGTLVYAGLGSGLGSVLETGGAPDLQMILSPAILLPLLGLSILSLLPILYRRHHAARNGQPKDTPHA